MSLLEEMMDGYEEQFNRYPKKDKPSDRVVRLATEAPPQPRLQEPPTEKLWPPPAPPAEWVVVSPNNPEQPVRVTGRIRQGVDRARRGVQQGVARVRQSRQGTLRQIVRGNTRLDDIVVSFVGLGLALALWYVGGVGFSTILKPLHAPMLSGLPGLWPWSIYILLSIFEIRLLPNSLTELRARPWYVWLLWLFIVAVDISAAMYSLLQFFNGLYLPLWDGVVLSTEDQFLYPVSLVFAIAVAFLPEPVVRHFWPEFKKALGF